jgi:hypothetical protein
MAKKSGTTRGARKTSSSKGGGGVKRAPARKGAAKRKAASARKPKASRKPAPSPSRAGKLKRAATAKKAVKKAAKRTAAPARKKAAAKASTPRHTAKTPKRGSSTKLKAGLSTKLKSGGTGREETLAQTPETGRTRRGGLTNPLPTKRSTGTPAGAGTSKSPRLERARRQLREIDETVPSPPSSLDLDSRGPSAARSGRQHLEDAKADHTETSPVLTGGDVDADWEDAYAVGDEAPGGDNPTPDQDRVDDIGKALGVTYDDNEELKASDKITERDKHRWELDPASSEDYPERD